MSGSPAPSVSWFKDNKEVKAEGRVSLQQDGSKVTMNIKEASEADSGCYKVKAANAAGEAVHEIMVKVAAKVVEK